MGFSTLLPTPCHTRGENGKGIKCLEQKTIFQMIIPDFFPVTGVRQRLRSIGEGFRPGTLLGIACLILLANIVFQSPISAQDTAEDTIKVAAVFSMTGLAAKHNAPMMEMTRLAVENVNSRGGVLGQRLELIELDNRSTPIGSAIAAQQAVSLGVVAVIGGHWSSHSLAMAPILQDAGIPMISPSSTNPEVTLERDYVFRLCFVDSFQGKAMAQFAVNDLRARRAVVVSNVDERYSSTLAHYFDESFRKASGEIVADLHYRGDAIDFSDIINKIVMLRPDIVYLPGYTRDSGVLIKQARKVGVTATFLGGDGWDDIASVAGDAIDGSYHTAAWHPMVPYEASKKLNDAYMEKFGGVIENYNSPLAYDAVLVLEKALLACACLEGEALKNTLHSMPPVQGATGEIFFDEQGNPINKKIIIIEYDGVTPVYKKSLHP